MRNFKQNVILVEARVQLLMKMDVLPHTFGKKKKNKSVLLLGLSLRPNAPAAAAIKFSMKLTNVCSEMGGMRYRGNNHNIYR